MTPAHGAASIVIVAALACFASSPSFAQAGMPPPPGHGIVPFPDISGLTEQQKDQITKLHLSFGEKALALQNQLGEKEARLRTLTTAKTIDGGEVNRLVDEIGQLRTQLFKAHVNNDLKIRELLNDEQRVFFDTHSGPQGPPPGR